MFSVYKQFSTTFELNNCYKGEQFNTKIIETGATFPKVTIKINATPIHGPQCSSQKHE